MLRYQVVNVPRFHTRLGQATPARYVPSATDCASIADFQKAIDNAAARMAYYQTAMQAAVAAGDDAGVNDASAGSDLANRDWNAWTKKVKDCGSAATPGGAPPKMAPSTVGWVPIVVGVGVVSVVGLWATGVIKI